jgi:hypothetical protein
MAGIGKGSFGGIGRGAVLERRDGESWSRSVGSAPSSKPTSPSTRPLGPAPSPDELRITEVGPSVGMRVAMTVGIAVAAVLVVWVAYIVFIGPL